MKILTGRVLQNGLMAVFLLALLLTAIRLWPHPPLWQGLPQSSVYYDRHGALLCITLANDDRYRLWTPLEQVSPLAVRGLLLHEGGNVSSPRASAQRITTRAGGKSTCNAYAAPAIC